VIDDMLDAQQGRRLADMIADCCGMAIVFSASESGYNYAVISREGDASGISKAMNAVLEGRGGGRGGFAQGSVKASKNDIEKYFSGVN